jgi:polynucleotide 5'-kinase involved in rRNA processing
MKEKILLDIIRQIANALSVMNQAEMLMLSTIMLANLLLIYGMLDFGKSTLTTGILAQVAQLLAQ